MSICMTSIWLLVIVALLCLSGAGAAQPQDIEWRIADELQNSLRPPDGMMYPNEVHLAGPRTIGVGEPLRCWLRAAPSAVPLSYDGLGRRVELRAELRVELLDAAGTVVAVERPAFPRATVFAANRPAYYDVDWQALSLSPGGLEAGDYRVVAWIDTADGIPHNRVEKQVRVVTPEEARELDSLRASPETIATAAGLAKVRLDGGAGDDPREAVLIPSGREVNIPLPGSGRVAVYGLLAAPSPEFTATLARVARLVPAFTDGSYVVRERFLGVGQGGADSLTLAPGDGALRLAGVRVEPLPEEISFVPRDGNGGKELVVNNDGGSEGFWTPTWDPMNLPDQVNRYQGSDVSQFEFQTLLGELANYRSRYVDFYGEHFDGTWPASGYEAMSRHFNFLDTREPRLFPWLKKLSDEIGLTFWGSQRMNADYGGHAEMAELFHSRFQKEHPEMRVLHSPAHERPSFLLSYAQGAVRERRIGVLRELAEFGAAGVNLDFCRYPTVLGYEAPMPELFRQAHGEDGTEVPFDDPRWIELRQQVMNGFMREVRAAMDAEGRKRGRPVLISVRLPATKYETFGFDPQTWIREGLVDRLIPAYPGWARWFDVSHWTEMAEGTEVEIWPGWDYFFYETATAELTDADVARGLKPGYMFRLGRSDYLRRAAEAYADGAGGFHMFNAWGRGHVALIRGISDAGFVANWRQYLDPANLASEIATDSAR